MSNSGVLFETSEILPCGEEIELAIEWPTKLNNAVLNLRVKGITVRARNGYTAVSICQSRFDTEETPPMISKDDQRPASLQFA